MRLQQQYIAVRAKIDRAYEDRLARRVSDDLWQRKSTEWELSAANVSERLGGHVPGNEIQTVRLFLEHLSVED